MKTVLLAFVTLGCLNTYANIGFNRLRGDVLANCAPDMNQSLISHVIVETLGGNYQAIIRFIDDSEEVFPAAETIARGNWPRLLISRGPRNKERVVFFDIIHPKMDFDYGAVFIRTSAGISQVNVNCTTTSK